MDVYLVVSSLHVFRLQLSATFSSQIRATCTVPLIVLRIVTTTPMFVDAVYCITSSITLHVARMGAGG